VSPVKLGSSLIKFIKFKLFYPAFHSFLPLLLRILHRYHYDDNFTLPYIVPIKVGSLESPTYTLSTIPRRNVLHLFAFIRRLGHDSQTTPVHLFEKQQYICLTFPRSYWSKIDTVYCLILLTLTADKKPAEKA